MSPMSPNIAQPKRDYLFETDAILCSCVELEIRNHAGDTSIRAYIPVAFAEDGNPLLAGGAYKLYPRRPAVYPSIFDMPHGQAAPSTPWALITHDMAHALPVQRKCQPMIEPHHDFNHAAISSDLCSGATFVMLRLAQLNQQTFASPWGRFDNWDMEDRITGRMYGVRLHMRGDWNAEAPVDGAWMFTQAFPSCDIDDLNCYDAHGDFRYTLRIFCDYMGHYAVLPLALYQHPDYPGPLTLFTPPEPSYVLVNSQWIGKYPNATVILTDDFIAMRMANQTQDYVVLFNPGGDAWIDNLDLQPLQGRRVICHAVVEEGTPEAQRKAGQSLLLMANRLSALGITPTILPPQPGPLTIPYSSPFQASA